MALEIFQLRASTSDRGGGAKLSTKYNFHMPFCKVLSEKS